MGNNPNPPFCLKQGVSPMWKITLAERVKFLLASKGMTQNQLADLIGVNHGTLSKVINEHWSPTAKIKLLMARHLGIDSLVLFGDKRFFEDYQKSIKEEKKGNA